MIIIIIIIITDRTISANRPDIVFHDKAAKECLPIDVTIPNDKNISLKEVEKVSKYKDLELEIRRMWNTKTRVVTVIIGSAWNLEKRVPRKTEQATMQSKRL